MGNRLTKPEGVPDSWKRCSWHKAWHPFEEFTAAGRNMCRAGVTEYNKKWYTANSAYAKECAKKRRAANPTYQKEYERKRRAADPECFNARYKRWSTANPGKVAAKWARRLERELTAPGGPFDPRREDYQPTYQKFNYLCAYCGGPFETPDHMVPLSRAGTNYPSNIVPCCGYCQQHKNALLIGQGWPHFPAVHEGPLLADYNPYPPTKKRAAA